MQGAVIKTIPKKKKCKKAKWLSDEALQITEKEEKLKAKEKRKRYTHLNAEFQTIARKAFLSVLAILWNFAFKWVYLSFSPLPLPSLLFSAICKASSDNHFAFLHFFFLGMVLITASCTMSQTSIHSSSGTALQIAEKRREVKGKGEKERYTDLNAEFQRIARRDKKAFLSG